MLICIQDPGTAGWDGYELRAKVISGPDSWEIRRVTNGAATVIASKTLEIAAGGTMLLRRLGNSIEFWWKPSSGSWAQQLSVTDITYMWGMIGTGGFSTGVLDDFSGGSLLSLLDQYAPELRFWNEEPYRADSAAVATDLFLEQPVNHSVVLKCCWPMDFGTVASADPNSSLPRLSLSYLNSPQPALHYLSQPKIYPDDIAGAAIDYLAWIAMHPEQRRVVYGRVFPVPGGSGGKILQYWMFYYYNPKDYGGFGNHEGDWEWAQIRLSSNNVPLTVSLSQHGQGETCNWGPADVEQTGSGRPVVYVAHESHANYFWPGSHNAPFAPDETGAFGAAYYESPTVVDVSTPPGWITWDGHWGASTGSFLGPTPSPESPGAQEEPWDDPSWWEANKTGPCTQPPGSLTATNEESQSRDGSSRTRQDGAGNPRDALDQSAASSAPALPETLSARVEHGTPYGKAMEVSYCFPTLRTPPSKRPRRLHLSVENVKDNLPPLSVGWEVAKRCAKVIHPIGPIKPPYLLRYSVESRTGTRSKPAVVRVANSGALAAQKK
ncbi:MAG: Vps62-related protein [Gaiella sp.]